MIIEEIILIALAILLCSGLIYFYKKFTNKSDECFNLKYEKDGLERKYNDLYKSLEDIKTSTEKEMEEWKSQIEKESSEEIRIKTEALALEYDEALQEEMDNLNKKIEEVDKLLGERVKEIVSKNTLLFTCVCDRTRKIPCTIDFSAEENRFTCDVCGAEYRVEISAYPVLLSNVSSNQTLASLYDN